MKYADDDWLQLRVDCVEQYLKFDWRAKRKLKFDEIFFRYDLVFFGN